MERDFDGDEVRRPRTWLWILLLLLIMFGAGMFAAGYAVTHDARIARFLRLVPAEQAAADTEMARRIVVRPLQATVPTIATTTDPALAARLAALEGKVGGIEAQAREATGDASRAEGLLVAFAARRALDRGVELGYIEGLLRQRFGQTQPQAVAMILSASRLPVTLADLQTQLDGMAPKLAANGGEVRESWWQSFRQELAGLVVVRRAGEPSSQPADRVARAQRMVEAGQVDGALAEILRLPDHSAANAWIVAARRYLAGRGALDRIETAALLDPATTSPAGGADAWPNTTPVIGATAAPAPQAPAPASSASTPVPSVR
jgi:hypothetical protein